MRQLVHTVQIIADNTDVFGGTIIDEVPTWAKHLLIQCGFSDYDALLDLSVQRSEYLRQSAPHVFAADNLLNMELTMPHVVVPVDKIQEFPVNLNFNVVTGGVGLAVAVYTS